MIDKKLLDSLSSCKEGTESFLSRFPNGASYFDTLTLMEKEYSIWLLVSLARKGKDPHGIISSIPLQCNDNPRRFYYYITENWLSIKKLAISRAAHFPLE